MRVPEQMLKCVCFLCVQRTSTQGASWRYGGTGFFVAVPCETRPPRALIYVVTARHCIDRAGGPVHLRVNRIDGDSEFLKAESGWAFSADPAADVAVLPWAPPPDKYEYTFLPPLILLTPERRAQLGIGPGDELIITGLFTERYGRQRNLPIVRTGIIAAMPDEPLFDENTGLEYPAYVAEVRSIGGLSGSPVFAYLPPERAYPGAENVDPRRCLFLLGIVRGHWDYKTRKTTLAFSDDELQAVNMGMALITPIEEVTRVIHGPELTASRSRAAAEMDEKPSAMTKQPGHGEPPPSPSDPGGVPGRSVD